jgi:saccharopine dehydrogenase-like NADP-dependent oxidoreductase
MLKGTLKKKGVIPPEMIGMDDTLFKLFTDALEKHEIRIAEEEVIS